MRKAGAMRTPAEFFNLERALSLEITPKYIICHGGDDFRRKARRIDFTGAGDTTGCCQCHKNKITPAKAGGWVFHNKAVQRCKLHGMSFLTRVGKMRRSIAASRVTYRCASFAQNTNKKQA